MKHDIKCTWEAHAVRSYPNGCYCWCHDLTLEQWTESASLEELEHWTSFKIEQRGSNP